jgi:hypothetical protein
MSKLDAQRAMREAKYARDSASGPTRREAAAAASGTAVPVRPAESKPTAKSRPRAAAASAQTSPSASEELCGHKSMNGRACTREAGHSEKSHRYS